MKNSTTPIYRIYPTTQTHISHNEVSTTLMNHSESSLKRAHIWRNQISRCGAKLFTENSGNGRNWERDALWVYCSHLGIHGALVIATRVLYTDDGTLCFINYHRATNCTCNTQPNSRRSDSNQLQKQVYNLIVCTESLRWMAIFAQSWQ